MRFRKLRIAWSVTWAVVAVLLVAMTNRGIPSPLFVGHVENEILPDGSVSRTYVDEIIPVANGEIIPIWLLIVTPTTFATLPWLAYRFTLRTLLFITTLVAVALGLSTCLR